MSHNKTFNELDYPSKKLHHNETNHSEKKDETWDQCDQRHYVYINLNTRNFSYFNSLGSPKKI